ncbi:MAG: ABC transporter permease [Oscillospiraceae bacterium]|nr:ABC transporter permease [Oscillospiraceae bacterium]
MNRVLRKRLLRDLRSNLGRYTALMLLIVMGIFLVTSLVVSSDVIISGTEAKKSENMVEDGQFSVFLPLSADELDIVSDGGTTIEKMFSLDLDIKQGQKVRMFKNRKSIDLIQLDEGRLAADTGEAVIEKRFSEVNGISVGSTLTAGGVTFTITGIGTVPDYDNMLAELSDTAVQSELFGLIFVTDEQYDAVLDSGTQKAEDYTYAYRLGSGITDDDIKDRITNLDFDATKVTDRYFRETIDDILNDRKKIEDSVDELCDATAELDDGAGELSEGADELSEGADKLSDGARELSGGAKDLDVGAGELDTGAKDLADGAKTLSDGMSQLDAYGAQLSDGADALIDGYLATVQSSLSAYGLNVPLTRENYATVLDSLALVSGQKEITELRQSLDSLLEFKSGVDEYTSNVSTAAAGAKELSDGADKLKDGTSALSSGAKNMRKGANDLSRGAAELSDGADRLADGTSELKDGTETFRENADDLRTDMDELLDRVFEIDIDNLTSFIKRADNIRIGAAAGDVVLNRMAGLVAGIIMLILFSYVISVFVVHQIERESGVIGSLYALGVKKKDLLAHYITLPTIIAFVGGAAGFFLALTPIGIRDQMGDSYDYFSLPEFPMVYPVYMILYAFVLPPLISAAVNAVVINSKLSRTALSLMRNEQSDSVYKQFAVRTKSFRTMFAVRQLVREMRSAVTLLLGLFFSMLVVMLGMNTYTMCSNGNKMNIADTRYEYMYMYKYPTDEAPSGGEKAYVKDLSTCDTGYNLSVTVIGLDKESSFFDVHPEKSINKAVINNSIYERLGYRTGDKVTFTDDASGKGYTFTVSGVCSYSPGFTVFMDRESMCDLFGEEKDYYNAVYSDKALDIEEGRLYSITTREDIERASGVFIEKMQSLIWTLVIAGTVIFCVVMYLMMGVMIDRAAYGISLIKIFGFKDREIRSLYLNGNLAVVAVGGLLCMPVAKAVIDTIYPSFIANVACTMDLTFPLPLLALLYVMMIVIYLVINEILVFRIKRITPAEVLKNRE